MFVDWKNRAVRVVLSTMLMVCFAGVAAAAPKPSKDQAALAKGWSAFYNGKYAEVGKVLPRLFKSKTEAVRAEARHLAARVFWAGGKKRSRAKALKLWKVLKKQSTLNVNLKRMIIADALQLHADGQTVQAIEKLEAIMAAGYKATSTSEAAVLLATIESDRAKCIRACDFAIKFSRQLAKGGEALPYASVKPFIKAARQLKEKQKDLKKRDETDPAELAFQEADKLRKARKFKKAVKAFQAIIKKYGGQSESGVSVWCDRSGYAIGLCLKDSGDIRSAVKWWRKFIDELPTGPWRGQAYLEVIDANLEHGLNIPVAIAHAKQAAEGLAAAEQNKKTAASWKPIAVDLHLRVGLLSYVGGDYETAVASLTKALEAAKAARKFRKSTLAGLERIIAAAEAKKPIIPADVSTVQTAGAAKTTAAGDAGGKAGNNTAKLSRTAATLSMATIYNITSRHGEAERMFELVLSGQSGKATIAQRSYAEYGLAVAAQSYGQLAAAQKHYLTSFEAYKKGSWHDDTLCQLATAAMKEAKVAIAEAERQLRAARRRPLPQVKKDESAKRKAKADKTKKKNARRGRRGKGNRGKKGKTKPKKPAKPKSPTELLAEREKVKAAQLPIWSKALKYWQELAERYPASRHVQAARYNIGVIYFEVAQAKKGAEALEKLVADHPKGVYTGESLLLLGRYALEYVVDPVLARKYFTNLDKWADETRESAKATITTDAPKDPAEVAKKKGHKPLKEGETRRVSFGSKPKKERQTFDFQVLEKCHTCDWYLNGLQSQCAKFLGFLHFVDGEKEKALAQYDRLTRLDSEVAKGGMLNDLYRLKWGIDHGYLYAYPQELELYEGKQRLGVLLADMFFCTEQFGKSVVLAKRMVEGELGTLKGNARHYPRYLYATCLYRLYGSAAAFPEYMKILKGSDFPDGTNVFYTVDRAAYAAGNIASSNWDERLKKNGMKILQKLAKADRKNEHVYKAKINYAVQLIHHGNKRGFAMLENFPSDDKGLKKIANMYLKHFKGKK
ncbi:MAG: hypothetical protein K8S55_05315 [Phycisphaerae bacterium]|nr:hypothetical protein [Phycisphaerae bacterium]